MSAKFQIFKDKAGEFRFRLKAPNGLIVAASQKYTTKQHALEGVESVKRHAPAANIEDITDQPHEHH